MHSFSSGADNDILKEDKHDNHHFPLQRLSDNEENDDHELAGDRDQNAGDERPRGEGAGGPARPRLSMGGSNFCTITDLKRKKVSTKSTKKSSLTPSRKKLPSTTPRSPSPVTPLLSRSQPFSPRHCTSTQTPEQEQQGGKLSESNGSGPHSHQYQKQKSRISLRLKSRNEN